MDDLVRCRNLMEQMNVGVMKYLETKTGVSKIELEPRRCADRSAILSWEQKHSCFLPEDLKCFYLTSDGFHLTWSVKIDSGFMIDEAEDACSDVIDDGPIPVGRMCINKICNLLKIGGASSGTMVNPTLLDLDSDSDMEDESAGRDNPKFDSRCKIFELDPCDGYGKVCLVYREAKPGSGDWKVEIWFLDRGLRWHYITDTFMAYYRLMIMHLGLPQWQYAFTDIGLCQQAKQWFNMYAPLRLELDSELGVSSANVASSTSATQIDVGKVFRGKSDKKKPVPAQTQSQQSQSGRKKPAVASAKTGQQAGLKPSGSSSQLAGKK